MQQSNRVIIIGGGLVGLTQALALGQAGLSVTLIEGKQPLLQRDKNSLDAWVSALNLTSQKILMQLGIWQTLPADSLAPLDALCVWDQLGGGEIHFNGGELGKKHLGHIITNREVIKVLWQAVKQCPHITCLCPAKAQALSVGDEEVTLTLDDEQVLTANLAIGADGGHSWLRQCMGIKTQEKSYNQQAVIAVVKSEKNHQKTGWQNFMPTGPLAYLPLTDSHHGAIVWSADSQEHQRLMKLQPQQMNSELTRSLGKHLGTVSIESELRAFPLTERHAEQYVKPRLALIGDAAHTIHPLAGQGANLGLMDAACLTQTLIEAHEKGRDVGQLRTLRRFERWRKGDNEAMLTLMRAFKTVFAQSNPAIIGLRSLAFSAGDQLTLIKRLVMEHACGDRGELPSLAISDCRK